MANDSYKLNIDVSVSQNAEEEIKSLETTVSGLNEKITQSKRLLSDYKESFNQAFTTKGADNFLKKINNIVSQLANLEISLAETEARLNIIRAQANQNWNDATQKEIILKAEGKAADIVNKYQREQRRTNKNYLNTDYRVKTVEKQAAPENKQKKSTVVVQVEEPKKLQNPNNIKSNQNNTSNSAVAKVNEVDRFTTSTAKTRIAEVQQMANDISKEFATKINNQVKEWVNQLHGQGVSRVSSSKKAEMYEAAYADEYTRRKNAGNLVVPTGRSAPVWEYKEAKNTGAFPNAGVLTTRSYESFVVNGNFIPSSKYTVDENGVEGREYFKTLAVADDRLRNKDKVGGIKSLYNASIDEIAKTYEQLEKLKGLKTTPENVKQSIEKFQKDIVDAIVQSFANSKGLIDEESGLDEFQKMLSSRLFRTDSFNKNNYEELFGDVDYSKKGSLWDILRGQITDVTTPLRNQNNDDKTERWIENQTPDNNGGRDNKSEVEQKLLQQIKEITQKAENNKDAQTLVDLLNDKSEWTPGKTFSQSLKENPEDTIQIAKEVITQIIDILANGNVKQEVKFDKDEVFVAGSLQDTYDTKNGGSVTRSDFLHEKDDDFGDKTAENIAESSETLLEDQAVQEAKISEMKENLKGALGYVSEWVKHVDEGYTDEQIDSLITQVEEIEEVGKTLSNDEMNQLVPFLNKFSSDSNYVGNIPKVLEDLHSVIEGILSQRSIDNEKDTEALTLNKEQKKAFVNAGGKFKNDPTKEQELTDEIDKYYGQGWVDSVSKALDANAGELDDKAREFMTEILNSLFNTSVSLDTPEGNDLAKKLISVTHGDGGIVSLYNILSKMYEDSNTVDASIKRRVDALNNATGNQGLYNFDDELAKWKEANPNDAKKYDRSKLMRETFNNNGGFLNTKKALEAVFNLDDYYLQQLGERWKNLNYELTETLTQEEKQADGSIKKVKKTVTENAQDIAVRGFEGRTTLLGVNPDSKSGQNYYSFMRGTGLEVPEEVRNNSTPQQLTSQWYKMGIIGASYGGGTNPEQNLINAKKLLAEKEQELAEASEEKAKQLEAEITLIKSDIEELTKGTTRRNKDTSKVKLIQTPDDAKPQKEEKKAPTESKDAVYNKQKAQEKLRTDIKNYDAVGSTVKHNVLGQGKITALDLDKGTLKAKFGDKEKTYVAETFIKGITDYLPTATKELGKQVGEETVKQAKNAKVDNSKIEDFTGISGETNIGGDSGNNGTGNGNLFNINESIYINGKDILVDSTTSQVNSEKVQVETSNSEFTSNGKAIINLNGGEFTGSASIPGKNDGPNNVPPQTFTQFEKGVKYGSSSAFMVRDTDKGFYDTQGNRITGATTYIKDLTGWSVPEQEAKIKTLKDQISRLGEGESLKAEDTVFSQEEFEKLRHAANNSVRGEILHELLEEFAKSGKSVNEIGADLDTYINAFKETEKYKTQMAELSKWGLGEDFVNLKSSMESILNAMSLGDGKDLSFTKLAESAIGLKMTGNQGDVTVAARLDSLLSGLNGYVVNDWKSGYSGASAILQNSIERQALISLSDVDDELKQFIQNLGIDVEMLKKMNNEVLITQIGENGETNIVPAQATSAKNIYSLLAYRNNRILQGSGEVLSADEKQKYIGVAETWNARTGRASDFVDNSGEFIQPSDAEQNKAVNQYYSAWAKYIKEYRTLLELKDELDNATEKEKQNLQERIYAQQEVVSSLKNFVPEYQKMTGQDENGNDVTLGYKIGDILVSPDKVEGTTGLNARMTANALQYRRQRIEKQYAGVRSSSGSGGLKATANDTNDIISEVTDQNKKFQSLFDMDAKGLYDFFDKNTWGNIDTSMGNIEEKFKVYKDSLNQIIKYTKDYVKNQTELETIEKRISELKEKGYDDNSQEIQTLEREKKLREETLATVKEQIDIAQKNKENTGLDKAARSGQLTNNQTKEYYNTVVNAQNKMSTELNNTRYKAQTGLNLDTTKMGANQSIQEYLNAYKEELRIQEQIEALRGKMQDQTGTQLENSKLYEQALTTQLSAVQKITQGYDAQAGTLNGIKLTTEEIENINKNVNKLDTQHQTNLAKINSQVKVQKNFLQEILNGFKQSFAQFSGANVAFEIIQRIKQGISEVIQITQELDADLVDLQIASGSTREEMYSMLDGFADLGNQLGRTTRDISEAANDWLRAGYEGKEATDLIKASTQLSTLGMINTSDATSYLISVLKGWKLEASEVSEVVDKLTVTRIG